jgi:tetratricopeptide (TPR) repeat protein
MAMTSNLASNRQRSPWIGRAAVILLSGMAIVIVAWLLKKAWFHSSQLPANNDPRLVFETPYRNVRPEVRYVGDEACARCHRDAADGYRKHPMARSLAPVAQADPVERYGARAQNPFEATGFTYEVERSGVRLLHSEKRLDSKGRLVAELKAEVQYTLGSGTRGRSYLVDHDGFLFQSPISWYAGSNVWDLAPTYRTHNQHFYRPIPGECLFCHANRTEPVDGSLNHFRTPVFQGYAIGCERCHGPGELHVRLRESNHPVDGLDDTIVNPERLAPELRESVCQQCHLQGVVRVVKQNRHLQDFRPGLPLNQFMSYFVLPPNQMDTKRAVGQVEQMYSSRCFQESGKNGAKLGCISCHDPHYYPDAKEKVNYYRQRCLTCHTEKSCTLELTVRREKNGDNCIACHMPSVASSDIAHTAITDHRIVRRPDAPRRDPLQQKRGDEQYPIVPFNEDTNSSSDDRQRDLGIALIEFASKQPSPRWGQLAAPLLDQSLSRCPNDALAWESRGYAAMLQSREQEAISAFEAALEGSPNREKSLFGAALTATQLGRADDGLKFWQRAIAMNPWNWEYHDEIAKIYAARQDWKKAAEHCRQAVQLNIAAWDTRKLLVTCLLRLKQKTEAQKEFEILLGYDPPDPEALRLWFGEERK